MRKAATKQSLGWKPVVGAFGGPIYLALADAMEADIAAGRLRPGQSLPTQRALAEALGADLGTVTRGYAEARRRGLIGATVGRGTHVRGGGRDAPEPQTPIDMTMNLPPQPAEARLADRLAQGLAAVQRRADIMSLLSYRQTAGGAEERAAGAVWLRPLLGETAAERVVISSGAQAALAAALTLLARPGDTVATEALTYPGFKALAAHYGVATHGVAMDSEGMIPDALAEVCKRAAPKAIYCTPTIHNPTTATMSDARRAQIVAVARRHAIPIIEDDAYGRLPRRLHRPLASLAPELTYYVSTLAKCLTPGLRLAYCVTPDIAAAARLAAALRATSFMATPLMAALAAKWIADGAADDIVAALRREAALRQTLAHQALNGSDFTAHPEGHHLWLQAPRPWNASELAAYLRTRGVAAVAGEAFTAGGPAPSALRLALGAARDRAQLGRELKLVATVLAHTPDTVSTVI